MFDETGGYLHKKGDDVVKPKVRIPILCQKWLEVYGTAACDKA